MNCVSGIVLDLSMGLKDHVDLSASSTDLSAIVAMGYLPCVPTTPSVSPLIF
jgi:hypothetical protein